MNKVQRAGRLTLSFDSFGVIWPAIVGMVPTGIWLGALLFPLSFVTFKAPSGALGVALSGLATGLLMFAVLVGPALTAGLVQRARQPRPAHVEWDAAGLIEWDGDWKRTVIPWPRLSVGWQAVSLKSGSTSALQLRDRESGALIHCWGLAPSGSPPVRRRVEAGLQDIKALVDALDAHVPGFKSAREAALLNRRFEATVGSPDWSLAADRWAPRWMVRLGRLGYVGAVVAPLLAIAPPPPSGIPAVRIIAGVVAVVSAGLLALRAQPVQREWRTLTHTLTTLPAEPSQAIVAMHSKLNAVRVELLFRWAFVVLVLYSTVVSALFSAAHP